MDLSDMKNAIILLALVSLIGAASAIALTDFRDETTANSAAYNVTTNGLDGIDNSTGYLDTIGTIIGIAVLIGIVILAFTFSRQ
jgi:hypothetical protein